MIKRQLFGNIVAFLPAYVAAILLAACSFFKPDKKERIRFIQIYNYSSSFDINTGQPASISSLLKVAFFKNYKVYTIRYMMDRTKQVKDSSNKVIDEVVIKRDTLYYYIVCRKGDKKGLRYPSLTGNEKYVADIDSFMNRRGLIESNFKGFDQEKFIPVKTVKNPRSGKVEMEVITFPDFGPGELDSLIRYYDERLKDIDLSFVPSLDMRSNSKLVKLQIIINPVPKNKSKYNFDVPRRESTWEMKEIQEKNPQDYLNLIERFKRDSKAMNLNID